MTLQYPVGEGTHFILPGEYAYTFNYLIDDDTLFMRVMNGESRWKTYVGSQVDLYRYIWDNTDRSDEIGQALTATFSYLGSAPFYSNAAAMKDDLIAQKCTPFTDLCYS